MVNSNLLDIVIINWNSTDLLKECVNSIWKSSVDLPGKMIVVDNSASICGIDEMMYDVDILFLKPEKNLGFGGGCNLGASKSKAEYILFLNPDITFFPNTMHDLIEYITSDNLSNDTGIIGVQLLCQDGMVQENVARFPRPAHLYPRMLGLDRIFPSVFPPHFVKSMDYSETQNVEQVPGAFFLVRRTLFDRLNGFDPHFFMYYEDVDFCYRAFLLGWKILYYPQIQVTHSGGGTTKTISSRRLLYFLQSRTRYIRKHFGLLNAILVTVAALTIEFITRFLLAIFHFSLSELWGMIKVYAFLFISIPVILRENGE